MTILFETHPVSKVIGIFTIVLTSLGLVLTKFQEPILYLFFIPFTVVLIFYNYFLTRKLVIDSNEKYCSFGYTFFSHNFVRYNGNFSSLYFEIEKTSLEHGDSFQVSIMKEGESQYSINTHMDFNEYYSLYTKIKKHHICTVGATFSKSITKKGYPTT
ncbi:MAG: hypothetical protein ACJAZ2_002229 [Glaciecola sp.]|jgi:hypothetical protein